MYDEQELAVQRISFIEYFRTIVSEYEVQLDRVINMDQTAVDLSDIFGTTLEVSGSKRVKILQPTNLPKRVTILLAITFGGQFLEPLIIFHGKESGKVMKEFHNPVFEYPEDCEYGVQENAWTDQKVFYILI